MAQTSTPATRRPNAGQFRPGYDPRRHRFTPEECSAGFYAGTAGFVAGGGHPAHFLTWATGKGGRR